MTPARWQAVKRVLQDALERPAAERGAFLDGACAGDAALRREAAALLAAAADESAPDTAAGFLDGAAASALGDAGGAPSGGVATGPDAPGDRGTARAARLAAALGGRYAVERELGRGGMATVYLARDQRHHRPVALKVLGADHAAALGARRFLREIETAANLSHPHVLPLFDSGEADGQLYYVMPYVEGETLRARLAREGPLPVADAVRLVRELADALGYAHAHGVVHRDLKPENVLLSGGHAVVADFGIAKALAAATQRAAGTVVGTGTAGTGTALGVAIGTPAYMAPEQIAADPHVDGRADLYALGLVAYETLAGAHPFAGRAPQAMLAAHLTEAPAPVAERRPEVPPALAALVMWLLAKSPSARPQSAEVVVRALDAVGTPGSGMATPPHAGAGARPRHWRLRTAVVALAAVLLVAIAAFATVRARRGLAPAPPVLAVLPFENLGPPGDAYFADGLTEEVRGRLARVSGLQVIGGASARQYKGTTKLARQIARELGATHLLTASVRWERAPGGGGRVRVSPELVRASDQASVWSEAVEGPLTDVFQLQASVAERVAAALDVALGMAPGDGDRRAVVAAAPTANVAAYDAYLRGLAYAAHDVATRAGRRAAAAEFERAVALDPRFAAAHAQLARVYVVEHNYSGTPGVMERARASAARALALDSASVEARLAQAQVLAWTGDGEGAYRVLQAAERAAPNDAEVALALGNVVWQLERDADAIADYQRAERLEPRMALAPGMLAGAYEAVGRYEDALAAREREIALAPWGTEAYIWQAGLHLLRRADTASARRTLARAEPGPLVDVLARLPSPDRGGRALWLGVLPRAVLAAQDTMTLAGFLREGRTPDVYHLMKARHFWLKGDPARARAHADSIIALLAPALRRGPDTTSNWGGYTRRTTLAEAYAYAGRPKDAEPLLDSYVADVRRGWGRTQLLRPAFALLTAAYVDVLIGRRDLAVARLEEALRTPSGARWTSRALLRADPWWAPLHGHPAFERLTAGG
jgi:serine/threonine-protein kinase